MYDANHSYRKHLPELYYKAAQLNENLKSFVAFASSFRGELERTLNNENIIYTADWRDCVMWVRDRMQSALRGGDEYSEIYHLIESVGEMIVGYFDFKNPENQFPFSPHLVTFILLFEGFPSKKWEEFSEVEIETPKKFFFFEDDGPIPVLKDFYETRAKDPNGLKSLYRNYLRAGRFLDLKALAIEWSFTDDEIVEAFKRLLLKHRPSEEPGADTSDDKAVSYYRRLRLSHNPHHLLRALGVRDTLKDDNGFKDAIGACEHLSSNPFYSFQKYPKSQFRKKIRQLPSFDFKDGQSEYRNYPDQLEGLYHLINTGFNLPMCFLGEENDLDAIPRTILATPTFNTVTHKLLH